MHVCARMCMHEKERESVCMCACVCLRECMIRCENIEVIVVIKYEDWYQAKEHKII